MWFNRNFSAWLQRGYDELFKVESFLSKIKPMAVILYKFFSSWVLFFFFYLEELNLAAVSVYQQWLWCVCVHISTNKWREAAWRLKSRPPRNLNNCWDIFVWRSGFQTLLLGLHSQNSVGYILITNFSTISVIYNNKGEFGGMLCVWYRLNVRVPPNPYVEALIPNVMVWGGN